MDDWGGLENRCGLRPSVGSHPTLSAGRKKTGDESHSLSPTAVSLVIGLSKIKGFTTGVISTPEIAQLPLGDFAFASARIKLSPAFLRCRWNKPGSHRFKELQLHARCSGNGQYLPFFDFCKSHVYILRVNNPQETLLPEGCGLPLGESYLYSRLIMFLT